MIFPRFSIPSLTIIKTCPRI